MKNLEGAEASRKSIVINALRRSIRSLRSMFRQDPASRRPSRSIRARLIKIVLVLAVPAVIGLAALALGFYHHERDRMSQTTLSTVRGLMSALDRDLAGTTTVAEVLAKSASLAADDLAAFYQDAKSALPLLRGSAIVLIDATGRQIVNTSQPFDAPLPNRADLVNVDRVFRTGLPSVSDIFIGAISKTYVFFVDVPVFRNGQVQYTLGIAMHPDRLNGLFENQKLPSGWVATITDSSGHIVARSSDPELVGSGAPVRLKDLTPFQSGLVDTWRIDGTPILVGFSKSDVSDWTVALGVPTSEMYREPNKVLLYGAASVLGVLIAGLVLALYEAAQIAQAVQDLIPSALALGGGEAPSAPASSIRESDEVARALQRAHELLQVRTLERDSAEMTIAARSLADEMFRLAVEACPNGMLMIDADSRISMVNGEAERQFGYARDELIGQPVENLVPERFRSQLRMQRNVMLKSRTRQAGAARELSARRKDGAEFPIEVGLNTIRMGKKTILLCVIVDVSQRKRDERMKDEFVATVSHELKTPLTSIVGSLGLLVGHWGRDMPESAARLLNIAQANSQRLGRLVNDILDIEKIESDRATFNPRRVDVRRLVEQAIEDSQQYADNYGVRIKMDENSDDADVNADSDRLSQAVANLLSNAVKFSPPGGAVRVAVENDGDNLRITVRDHGPGVTGEFKPHLFEKFAQADASDARQKGGTGLGLSIVKQIVERFGGKAGFKDAPGGGAIFFLDLPVWDDTVGGGIDTEGEAAPLRVLFCGRDPAIKKAMRMQLSQAGLTVDFAHTAHAAIARSSTHRYAAIVISKSVGDDDGLPLVAQIQSHPHHADTLILIVSDDPGDCRAGVPSGEVAILDWMPQPLDVERVTTRLLKALSARLRPRPRILHVDDDRYTLAIVAQQLNDVADVVSAGSAESARRVLATDRIDLVIVDIQLGAQSGLELLPDIRDRSGNIIPVIIFSNSRPEVPEDDQIHYAVSKMTSSVEFLRSVVRDRLGLSPVLPEKEVA